MSDFKTDACARLGTAVMMSTAYISAGSNLGQREANLRQALADLAAGGAIIKLVSDFFETEPVDFRDQPYFLNIAVAIETTLSPRELMALCQRTENVLGRVRTFRGAPRILDLDILLYADAVVEEHGLTIPHPRMSKRRFVLEPLAQIAAEVIHPVLKQSIRQLLESCPDSSAVKHFPGDPPL